MSNLPINHMTLYKHGVGYYRRRGNVSGQAIKLSFKREEMDDLLKSLTVIDYGSGQVQGVDYDTPQSQAEKLAGSSVILDDSRSLRDLLKALRGRAVTLLIKDGTEKSGLLVGLDEDDEKPLKVSLVSLLAKETEQVQILPLNHLTGVIIQDENSASDLRFFLKTALGQETHRSITIRLSPGEHDLAVSYIAPAPTWRVSYRLVIDSTADEEALLQGWGIFDNTLEEDLEGISLSLTAGMPISFVYDLYTPHTPERPVIEDESRVAAGPILFEAPAAAPPHVLSASAPKAMARSAPMPTEERAFTAEAMADSIEVSTSGADLGQLFQYNVATPVTVGRGQSAMVPIVSSNVPIKKDLIYNRTKIDKHPIATIRLQNETNLTLEHGPVTVLDGGEYVGEAILSFTAASAEAVIAYAVELGVHIKEEMSHSTHIHSLNIKDSYLLQNHYEIIQTDYKIENRTATDKTVLIEFTPRNGYTIFNTPPATETTLNTHRYAIDVAAHQPETFSIKQRILRARREQLKKLSLTNLQNYLKDKLLNQNTYDKLAQLLKTWNEISELQNQIGTLEGERKQIFTSQTQIQTNMQALSDKGEEGKLRSRYVQQLNQSENRLAQIGQNIATLQKKIEDLKDIAQAIINGLSDE